MLHARHLMPAMHPSSDLSKGKQECIHAILSATWKFASEMGPRQAVIVSGG